MSIIARARRRARRLRAGVFGSRFILVYHKIERLSRDPWGIAVAPERFAEHLDVLAAYGPCLTISEMAQQSRDGSLPRRAVAITFDDGYADNLYQALPLLVARGLPATFYLIPGLLDSQREFWWDELERLLFAAQDLPEHLHMEIAGTPFSFALPRTDKDEVPQDWRAWEEPVGPRAALYLKLWAKLRTLPRDTQANAIDAVLDWAGSARIVRDSHRVMTRMEAAQLAREGSVEIGAHTMHHLSLPAHDAAVQRAELRASKSACSGIAGYQVNSFSYPYGDHTAETASLARDAGFSSACTTRQQLLRPGCDPYRLPRIQAHNWTGDELARKIAVLPE